MTASAVKKFPLIAIGLLAVCATPVSADTAGAADGAARPRIGLVLGGGGARGAAHIGVLRALEQRRIPVDAIIGTSMGAVVGGLYASGMDAAELEALVASIDWSEALSDSPQRADLAFRRKQDDAAYPMRFETGIGNGELLLPGGVIQGQNLDLLLRRLTIDASVVNDFDELPIPFRAVASDLVTGEAHVIGEGDLAVAIRASMSVPGAISPVRIDGRLLADGGLVGNLPVEIMQAMDVDVIIAVDVEFPLYDVDDLGTAVTVSEQMLTILIRRETRRQIERLGDDDVLIRPELGLLGSADFANAVSAIEPGAAAVQEADGLDRLALSRADYERWRETRPAIPGRAEVAAFVRVAQDSGVADRYVEARLDLEAGDPLRPDRLAQQADTIHGLGLYETVGYRLVDGTAGTGVEFDARAKRWGPDFLRFRLAIEDDFGGDTGVNVGARLTRTAINAFGAEWRNDVQLGTDPAILSEFYQPLGYSALFVAPRLDYGLTNFNAFVDEDSVARLRVSEGELAIDFGITFGGTAELRAGLFRGFGDADVRIGDPAIPDVAYDTGGYRMRYVIDSRDNVSFPRRGSRADALWTVRSTGLGSDSDADTVEVDLAHTLSQGKYSLQLGARYATTLASRSEPRDFFPLGGFLNLSGLERGTISGPHAALARAVLYRRIGQASRGLFDVPTYLGLSVEAGQVADDRAAFDLDAATIGGSLFAGIDTVLGPVYLAAGFAEGGRSNLYLLFGSPAF